MTNRKSHIRYRYKIIYKGKSITETIQSDRMFSCEDIKTLSMAMNNIDDIGHNVKVVSYERL